MLDPFLPWRMAQASTGAALTAAASTMNAWIGLMGQAAAPWTALAGTDTPPAQPLRPSPRTVRSWYRHPDEPVMPRTWMMPWLDAGFGPAPSPPLAPTMMATGLQAPPAALAMLMQPWQVWLRMIRPLPLEHAAAMGSAPVWPIAVAMMAVGLPQGAAWPTAEAGAHLLAATQKAAEGLEQMFASYRSSGGHASAQIAWPPRLN